MGGLVSSKLIWWRVAVGRWPSRKVGGTVVIVGCVVSVVVVMPGCSVYTELLTSDVES